MFTYIGDETATLTQPVYAAHIIFLNYVYIHTVDSRTGTRHCGCCSDCIGRVPHACRQISTIITSELELLQSSTAPKYAFVFSTIDACTTSLDDEAYKANVGRAAAAAVGGGGAVPAPSMLVTPPQSTSISFASVIRQDKHRLRVYVTTDRRYPAVCPHNAPTCTGGGRRRAPNIGTQPPLHSRARVYAPFI